MSGAISRSSFDSDTDDDTLVASTVRRPAAPASPSALVRVAKSLTAHEWMLGLGAVVAMYLVNGTYAPSVCALCTNVPAVIHSYRVIAGDASLVAHQATLCYWILLGSMTVFDHAMGNFFCYYLAKFLLLCAVYAHVVSKARQSSFDKKSENIVFSNKQIDRDVRQPESRSLLASATTQLNASGECSTPAFEAFSRSASAHGNPAPLTSKNSSLVNYVQWLRKHTPSGSAAPAPVSDHPLPSGDATPASSDTFSAGTSDFAEVPLPSDGPISELLGPSMFQSSTLSLRQRPIAGRDRLSGHTSALSTDWSRTLTPDPSRHLLATRAPSHKASIDTLPCCDTDLLSTPPHMIEFVAPFCEQVSVSLTNVTGSRFMWALKTNALDRVIATPTCGFLSPRQTVHLTLAMHESAKVRVEDSQHDRLAVDYVPVPEHCLAFDPAKLVGKPLEARRKTFSLRYIL